MEKEEKAGETEKKKSKGKETALAEKKGEKLERKLWERGLLLAAWKRGCGPTVSTPVVSWKEVGRAQFTIIKGDSFLPFLPPFSLSSSSSLPQFSARKLAAAVWEFEHYFNPNTMYLGVNNHHRDRVRRHHHHHKANKDEGFVDDRHHHHHSLAVDPHRSGSPDHHPGSAGSLRRHIAASLMRHHQSADRNHHALQPLSPASYGSSLEIAPYNPAATPDSSIELRGKLGESSYSFKTSTELLKVLNRIWTLEEQHSSNVSLVKALKNELNHARAKIKELLRDQQANRHEIDELMKQLTQDSSAQKYKEQERIDQALQSVREELEDERKLRKRSESLHRKLARELFEVKVALSSAVKDLEKERKSSELLEELCDEFAKGVREYARQAHVVKSKSDKEWASMGDNDNLILHISESWLDERMQMRERGEALGGGDGGGGSSLGHKPSVVDKLRHEIDTFLSTRAKESFHMSPRDSKETRLRRRSLESIPEASSAPQCLNREDSAFSDPQNTPREIDAGIIKTGEGTPTEISMLQKSDVYDSFKEGTHERRKGGDGGDEEGHGSNSKTVDKLISELLLSEGGGSFPPEYEYKEVVGSSNPVLRRNVSPVRQWMASMRSPDPRISESSMKMPAVRDNTLKSKLQEPKLKGQRSRLKILKGSS